MRGLQQGNYKSADFASLVQGTPAEVLKHSSDAGSVVIISIQHPASLLWTDSTFCISMAVCVCWGGGANC